MHKKCEVFSMRNVERAKQIAKSKGISFAFVCAQIGKSRSYLSEMLANNRDIPEKMLGPIANALGVTVEELMGEAPEQKEKPTPSEESELNAHAKAILYKYEQLNPAQRVMFEKMLDAALEAAKGKE
jgi:transcriptional regulator with XRE-family HTH domain|nr:MAG TPA: helix-turn-helix domain protein [Caudoviricetes sp.]